jgi:hypothetical protein
MGLTVGTREFGDGLLFALVGSGRLTTTPAARSEMTTSKYTNILACDLSLVFMFWQPANSIGRYRLSAQQGIQKPGPAIKNESQCEGDAQ